VPACNAPSPRSSTEAQRRLDVIKSAEYTTALGLDPVRVLRLVLARLAAQPPRST
jgi:hypothetical protein